MNSNIEIKGNDVCSSGDYIGSICRKPQGNPTYSHDAAGFWMWRTKDFCSDTTFSSQEAAEADYQAWKEVYENSEVVK